MQTPMGQTLVAFVAMAVFLVMAQRAQTFRQSNRMHAMRAAAASTAILAANAAMRMFGIDVSAYQTGIAVGAFACIALAGFFLVRSALRGETTQIRSEVQRRADEFKSNTPPDDKA